MFFYSKDKKDKKNYCKSRRPPKRLSDQYCTLTSVSYLRVDKIIGLPCGEIANKCNKLKEIPIHSENDLIEIATHAI